MSITVIGSANIDLIVHAPAIPQPGETLLGDYFSTCTGGKGANQAVAAARLGGEVTFIASVGKDRYGLELINNFKQEDINIAGIKTTKTGTGVAVITVVPGGENTIVVAPQANAELTPDDLLTHQSMIAEANTVITQLETPVETVSAAANMLHNTSGLFILNPAPAQPLPDELLACVDILTPNETEASLLTGIDVVDTSSAIKAAQQLREKGVKHVVMTLGANGALLCNKTLCEIIPAPTVKAVDTSAAGDTFNGAMAVALEHGQSLYDAIVFANKAAAVSVTRYGTQPSIPRLSEL